jgi:hypothetical protein
VTLKAALSPCAAARTVIDRDTLLRCGSRGRLCVAGP